MTTMTFGRLTGRGAGGLKARLAQWGHTLSERMREERHMRDQIFALQAHSDRALADMGIRRSDIERLVRQGR